MLGIGSVTTRVLLTTDIQERLRLAQANNDINPAIYKQAMQEKVDMKVQLELLSMTPIDIH